MTMAAVLGDVARLAQCSMLRASPEGECLRRISRAAAMVIDVACGPMAYKTQLLV
jgi:hypothetical protein